MASVYNGVGYKSFRAVRMFSGFVLNPTDCFNIIRKLSKQWQHF